MKTTAASQNRGIKKVYNAGHMKGYDRGREGGYDSAIEALIDSGYWAAARFLQKNKSRWFGDDDESA